MKLRYISLLCFLLVISNMTNAQVGMNGNNQDVSAALDINSTNKGLLIPRVTLQSLTDKTSINGNNPAKGLLVYNTNTALQGGKGHYYWNGSTWKKLANQSDVTNSFWSTTGNGNIVPGTNYIGTADNQSLQIKTNAQTAMNISTSGNIGFGNVAPANAAILDMSGTKNKALYLPQVPLTSPTDVTTVPNPQEGMIVYNTNANLYSTFDGTKWTQPAIASKLVTPQLMGIAKSTKDNTTSFTGGAIFYDTKSYDPENAIVLGTSTTNAFKYTVKKAGKHQVFLNFSNYTVTVGSAWYLRILKNGVAIAAIDASAAIGSSACLVALDDFAVGDVISVDKGGNNSGWMANLSKIAIYRFE